MNNQRDFEGASVPFDANLARAKQGDQEWNERHPLCTVCQTNCCLKKGRYEPCQCHACEAGVLRSGEPVHSGQCLIIFIKARAVETVAALINDVAAGVRVLRDRDQVPLTEAQVADRARNIVTGLIGNYDIVPVRRTPVDFSAKEIG